MIKLDYLEFYISHTCNFNCRGCNRFNNYLFLGHQRWKEHEHTHAKWAKRLQLDEWCIIGGEPTLNPDICRAPAGALQISSNGFMDYTNFGQTAKAVL